MFSRVTLFLMVLLCAVGAAVLAYQSPSARAQPASAGPSGEVPPAVGDEGKEYLGTRYRVFVMQSTSLSGDAGEIPLLKHLSTSADDAVVPLGRRPAAAGMFATIPFPNDFVGAVRASGGNPEIIFVGEGETTVGGKCSIRAGTRFPVQSVQMRGTSQTITTQFEKIGMKVDIVPRKSRPDEGPRPGPGHQVSMEFSTLSAFVRAGAPVISEFSSQGDIILPDAHMAVFAFFDRVRAETLGLDLAGLDGAVGGDEGEGGDKKIDTVTAYFVCLIRMDMGR